ncbi:hypothetical protein TNCV_4874651 [Trichonephila clavipes]|nr:hypothetical protein TNCV_4874651 [Trichonephila clavipes]
MKVCSKGMTNQHRTWGRKSRLVCENRDNCSRQEDNEPDEGDGQKIEGIWSPMVRLKKRARIQIPQFCSCCSESRPLRTSTCGPQTIVHQHIFRFTSLLHIPGGALVVVDLLFSSHASRTLIT